MGKVFDLKEIQTRLAGLSLYGGAIDGIFGPLTARAIHALLAASGAVGWRAWPANRLLVAARQALCIRDGIDAGPIDGLPGPQTRYAIEVYLARARGSLEAETWREDAQTQPPLAHPPTAARAWPRQNECSRFFGRIGENQTRLAFPYPMRIAWDTETIVRSTLCHEKVHDAAGRVLARTLDHYGQTQIRALGLDLFGGCLNVRRMRGAGAWSMHAWGIAFDFDPERNQLRWGRDRARFASPIYDRWFDLWEEEGAISLGRARNFDWMHVQFARL